MRQALLDIDVTAGLLQLPEKQHRSRDGARLEQGAAKGNFGVDKAE